jgi:hypothetical protein
MKEYEEMGEIFRNVDLIKYLAHKKNYNYIAKRT